MKIFHFGEKASKIIVLLAAVIAALCVWPGNILHEEYQSGTKGIEYLPSRELSAYDYAVQYFIPRYSSLKTICAALYFTEEEAGEDCQVNFRLLSKDSEMHKGEVYQWSINIENTGETALSLVCIQQPGRAIENSSLYITGDLSELQSLSQ